MSFTPASKALARFKVLDLTRVRAGPTAARQFADWGADVIKIELPRGLDESDMAGRGTADFQNLHRNKRSLTLNFEGSDGIAIFKRMSKTADVVIENYRPDVKFASGSITRAFVRSTSASSMFLFPASVRTDPIASVLVLTKSPRAWAGLMSITGLPVKVRCASGSLSGSRRRHFRAMGFLIDVCWNAKFPAGQWVQSSLSAHKSHCWISRRRAG